MVLAPRHPNIEGSQRRYVGPSSLGFRISPKRESKHSPAYLSRRNRLRLGRLDTVAVQSESIFALGTEHDAVCALAKLKRAALLVKRPQTGSGTVELQIRGVQLEGEEDKGVRAYGGNVVAVTGGDAFIVHVEHARFSWAGDNATGSGIGGCGGGRDCGDCGGCR